MIADDFDGTDEFAVAVQTRAVADAARPDFEWAIGGTAPDETRVDTIYATEPWRGSCAAYSTDDLATVVESLPDFCEGARLVKRQVTYGPWEYVHPSEIQ